MSTKLYCVCIKGEPAFENEARAIWAASEDEAVAEWIKTADGVFDGEPSEIEVSEMGEHEATPTRPTPCEERRMSVLRKHGWHYEDEDQCDGCEEWSDDVCGDCNQCPKCAAEDDEPCDCKPEPTTETTPTASPPCASATPTRQDDQNHVQNAGAP